ncbi:helix-turn-helix domain-containing protein [Pseudooceanicola atlanticus]|uniref:helix-turn-helix domain-containing protein n=1 Tax=Pseudooceanicola atlanticus TaxID=1461694 RepID=UPI002354F3BF|nr:helix-turn-helix transcriptional regulator [Pseudooceanicola atlanticus]
MKQQIDPIEVANRLISLRLHHGLSQGEFADSVGIDRSSYSKIEKATKPLKADMAFNIAERWGVSMDYLYRGRLTEIPRSLADALISQRTQQTP